MANANLPNAEDLRNLLDYDPETGLLRWKPRPENKTGWDKHTAGKQAFTARNSSGYNIGAIYGSPYVAHRVIWVIVHGHWPSGQVDHINGVRDDNRIENLRDVSAAENHRNKAKSKNNTSGCVGVIWDASKCRWKARITVDYRTTNLGNFKDKADAMSARAAAERRFGFHKNHGRNSPQ